jgi:hypothetical protein
MRGHSRLAIGGLITALAAVSLAGLALAPESFASGVSGLVPPVLQTAYTDSSLPRKSFVNPSGDLPVGTSTDASGRTHTSRAYLILDLSGLTGRDVASSWLNVYESSATDCQQRQLQLWQTTDEPAAPTWAEPRRELTLLGTFGGTQICPAYHPFDLTQAMVAALKAHRTTLALELRNATAIEADPAEGRTLSPPSAYAKYDTRPVTPTALYAGYLPCTSSKPYQLVSNAGELTLGAIFSDPDPDDVTLTGQFEVWPVQHPAQVTALSWSGVSNGRYARVTLAGGTLTNGQTYAWHARGFDSTESSSWSKTCSFVVDSTPPAVPTVTSTAFPADGTTSTAAPGGAPGAFTFSANGNSDTTAYYYSWNEIGNGSVITIGPHGEPVYQPFTGPGWVRPKVLGGPATVTLVPPRAGPNTLVVQAFDRAGNPSGVSRYNFSVQNTSPVFTVVGTPMVGQPMVLRLSPGLNVTGVLSYTYSVYPGTPQTVRARRDGTAEISIPITESGPVWVDASSTSRNGWISPQGQYYGYVDTSPTVSSTEYPDSVASGGVGVPGTFTFSPRTPQVSSYQYSFDGEPERSVPAGTDGKASVTWTPASSGWHYLYVYAVAADGTPSDGAYYYPTVN